MSSSSATFAATAFTSKPVVAQPLGRRLELVRAACRERDPVAVLPERAGDGQSDTAGSAGDECSASVQVLLPIVPKTAGGYLKLG